MLTKNGTPLYLQAEEYIKEKIASGEWPINHQIPPEPQLMEMFDISRVTLRHAIADLVNEGLLETLQGRGTFVRRITPHATDQTQIWMEGLAEEMHQLISMNKIQGSRKITHLLNLEDDSNLISISYLHFSEEYEEPFNFTVSYFPEETFSDIGKYFSKDTFYNILKDHYSIPVNYAISSIYAVNLDKECAEYFKSPEGIPTIRIQKIYYDVQENPIFMSNVILNPKNSEMQIKTSV